MDFRLTEEQELLLESVRDFVSRNITEEKVQIWYKEHGVPLEVSKAYLDAGFGLLGLPEEYDGTPIDNTTFCLIAEELSRASGASLPFILSNLLMWDIVEFGSKEQIKLAMDLYKETGKPPFCMAISESGAGSDNSSMTTVAKKVDGKIILNGAKTFVTDGSFAQYVLIVAKDEDPSPENKNYSMWLFPTNLPGIKTSMLHKIGQTIQSFSEMYFDNVVIEESHRVGEPGKGFINLMKNFEFERLLVCSLSLGLAQAAMEDAAAYAGQRVQFGKPIGSFQQIQQKLTDMEVRLQACRSLLYKTAWESDNGISTRLNSALCKRFIPKVAHEICSEALQIFGGIGYTTETRVSRLFQDSRGNQIATGTDEIMVHIAGRQIIKKYASK